MTLAANFVAEITRLSQADVLQLLQRDQYYDAARAFHLQTRDLPPREMQARVEAIASSCSAEQLYHLARLLDWDLPIQQSLVAKFLEIYEQNPDLRIQSLVTGFKTTAEGSYYPSFAALGFPPTINPNCGDAHRPAAHKAAATKIRMEPT